MPNTPIMEPHYDFSTSCTQETAVKHLLGWHWAVDPIRSDDLTDEEWELCDFSLQTLLEDQREEAECDYHNAKVEQLDPTIVSEKLAKLQQCDEDIKRAHYFLCCIRDELSKGECAELRIDPIATTHPNNPYITLASLREWAKNHHDIDILNTNKKEKIIINSDHHSIALQKIVKALINLFSAQSNQLTHPSTAKPNVNQITIAMLDCIGHRESLQGCSDRSIKYYIGQVINATAFKALSNTETKNLQKMLALLVDAYERRKTDVQNVTADVQKIAASLSEHLPTIELSVIENHIHNALAVRKNPDKPTA